MVAAYRKTTGVRQMSDAEAAWVAGYLEGEGSFFAILTRARPKARVSAVSTDHDVLVRLAAFVGTGSVLTVTRRREIPGRKPSWYWSINTRADVVALTDRLYPLMGARRREQIEAMRVTISAPIHVLDREAEGW